MLIVTIGMVIIFSSSIFLGLIIYAKYANCDPFSTKKIITHDQLVPYFVLDVAGKIPGLPGLFISGIFCAALRLVIFIFVRYNIAIKKFSVHYLPV